MTNPQSVDEGKVDVLAVMDRERSCAVGVDGYTEQDYQNALSARVAVAELIEAVYQYEREFNNPTPDYMLRLNRRIAMFDALARIGATP